jgi:hypothetical protein
MKTSIVGQFGVGKDSVDPSFFDSVFEGDATCSWDLAGEWPTFSVSERESLFAWDPKGGSPLKKPTSLLGVGKQGGLMA